MGEVKKYLGVSAQVLARLVWEGRINPVVDKWNRRRKLVSVRELEELKRQSTRYQ